MKLFDVNETKKGQESYSRMLDNRNEAYGWDSWKIPFQQKDDLIPKVHVPYPLKVSS